jgi:uncharacterized protein (TIGR03663 family)
MKSPRILRLGLLLIAAGALIFWSRELEKRPMHQDEAIGADKFHSLWAEKKYVYDPHEYHGPTLNYFTLPVVWVSGADDYVQTSEGTYRIVTVLFGVGLILLLRLAHDGLGWAESLCAGVLVAVSPAMSFYSRYYIHEVILVFFIFLAMAAGWRYSVGGKKRWAFVCAIALGLAYATKETWVLSGAAMGIGLGLALLWTKMVDGGVPDVRARLRWKVLVGAGAVGLVVAAIFFSGLFTNWRGPIDAVRTYSTYLARGTDVGDHDKPWNYYIGLLTYSRYGRGPIHTEAFILVLAVVGIVRALWPAAKEQMARAVFLRFLAFYSVGLLLIYSAIPYKTPWCLLGFLHGMILMAGVGAVAIVRVMPHISLRYIAAAILIVPAGHLAFQAWRINFRDYQDPRRNPYLYSTPTRNFMELVQRLEDLAKVSPEGRHMYIRVVTADCWPLPWYLRSFPRVEYWDTPSERDPYAMVVIGARLMEPDLDARLGDLYVQEHYGLRPQVILSVYIDKKLWDAFIKSRTR